MAKIVLDPKESGIEAFAKLFFSATRNMGLSDKEACEALKNSIEAAENAPAEEKYDWYGVGRFMLTPNHTATRQTLITSSLNGKNIWLSGATSE